MTVASRAWLPASVLLLAAGCVTPEARVHEYLDSQTAATVRTTFKPFVYAHEFPQFAANARDYLSIAAVDVDRSGDHRYYVVAVSWSTIDWRRAGLAPPSPAERIEISLGGKLRALDAAGHNGRPLGVSEPVGQPTTGYLNESWYAVTPADLRLFAASPPASVTVVRDSDRMTYFSWERADAALAALVEDLPTPAGEAARR